MDKAQAIEALNRFGARREACLFVIDFEMTNILVYSLNNLPSDIWFNFNGISNVLCTHETKKPIALDFQKQPFENYLQKFNLVINEINYGNSFLLNLTEKTPITTHENLKSIFYAAQAKYKLLIENKFCFFSPEPFVKIQDCIISAFPMKGTIDASIKNAASTILQDKKESAEHNTIVDLIRNDLSIVAKKVHVPQFKYVEQINKSNGAILQVSSHIEGTLPNDFHNKLGEVIFKLLPAGSISGAPKEKTIDIIQRAEQENRGYYTGISGIYDGNNLDSCVNIRFVEKEKAQYYYRSGGGLTFMSKAKKEYEEIYQKIYVPLS